MCVSNEPGFYKDGEFGFRVENVQMVQKHSNPKLAESFFMYENLTCAPYCRELLDVSLINPDNRAYIDNFHAQCLAKLTPFLSGEDADSKRALAYLKRQCAPME
jgi:Xaa-Pro aminopeptidase